jgi:hypothetical protein
MAQVVSTTRGGTTQSMDLGVFREGIVTKDDLHGKRWSRLFTQMSGCCILLNYNLWFKVEDVKTQ